MAQQNSSEEVDLGYLFRKSNNFFKHLAKALFQALDFLRKYFVILIILVLIGFAYGYYKDYNTEETYKTEVIVIPNFESVDYMYGRVEAINLKIAQGDTLYLKNIFGKDFGKLQNIELEAIVDIYNFISKSYRNYDVLRLIAENQDFSKYAEDLSTSKYYKYHRMIISIKGGNSSENIVTDLLAFLNENNHFKDYQKVYKENNELDIQEHYLMISQIDSVMKANSNLNNTATNVSINNGTDLFNLIDRKRQLIKEILELKMEAIDFSVPIKIVSADYNLESSKIIQIPNKIKYPLLLVFLFSLVFFIIYLFKSLKKYSSLE
ncbi:hypothetical protein [Aequorivita sp. CIP111184]|uniref:hypothetical protein n=1 Tax=Aequorivita sp. CIP111184 TaxID=2211356 RepID=UPI000DBBD9CF|nr:hypothetical protein [Aequorivita sp. CIP111184]SRX52617.1 hypothetical protein AEQU1_00484 [Aequorivita sp. CIP111184]